MNSFLDISIIIPVREGSSRIKNKIWLPFHNNLSLLEWKIEQMKKILQKNRIFISSNSSKVKSIAKNFGVEFLYRSDYLSTGHAASFSEVIVGVVKDIPTNHFAWVTVVAPLMGPKEYYNGFKCYIDNVIHAKNNDSLVSVNRVKEYFWNDKRPVNYQADKNHTISQELPILYRVTNGLYMRSKEDTLREGYFLGKNPFFYAVDKISGVDIDEYEDYQIALALKKIYNEKNICP